MNNRLLGFSVFIQQIYFWAVYSSIISLPIEKCACIVVNNINNIFY